MSSQSLALRQAVDARPPALPWVDALVGHDPVSPDQPPLRFVDDLDLLTGSPVLAHSRPLLVVDVVPAGVDAFSGRELEEQARTWAPWFAQLLAEALDGRRQPEALGHWLDEWVLAEVSRRVRLQRRARLRTPAPAPVLPGKVVSLRTQFSHPRVLEVSAHLRRGRHSYAWAFQLRQVGDRWRCTALDLRG